MFSLRDQEKNVQICSKRLCARTQSLCKGKGYKKIQHCNLQPTCHCYRLRIQFWISIACWRFRIQPCCVQHLHVFYFLLIVELLGFRVRVNQDSLRSKFVEIVACYFPTEFGVTA